MYQKVSEGFASDVSGPRLDQPRLDEPTHCGMNFRGAHPESLVQFGIAPLRRIQAKLERNQDILWFGNH